MTGKAMGTISKDTTVKAIQDQVSCVVGEEAVILHLKDGTYYGLNAVGATVWNLIQQPRTVAELRDSVLRQYEVERSQCEQDLTRLLQELTEAGLIDIREPSSPAS
ncbi:MAG: PqqD family protein [Terriglobales bacterium]